jgi:DNA-binding GntR family transcriptional regulator
VARYSLLIYCQARVLAELIGINRNTVKLAYEELISQGWAESIERKGVFVLSKLPVRSKTLLPEQKNNLPQEAFIWTNKFENADTRRESSENRCSLLMMAFLMCVWHR